MRQPGEHGLRFAAGTHAGWLPAATTTGVANGIVTPVVMQWKVPLGARVCDVVAARDTDHVYVAADDCVTVMVGSDMTAQIPVVGPGTKRMILGADGTFLYVVAYDGSVQIINTLDHTVMTVSGRRSTAEVVAPDGRHLYTAHPVSSWKGADSWISAMAPDGTSLGTVAIENYATGMDLSPDGAHLYVATSRISSYTQYFPGEVTVIDTAHHAVVDTITVPVSPDTVTVTPDGSHVLVTHYDINAISAIDVVGRSVTTMSLPDAPLSAAVTPDGTKVYVVGVHSLLAVDFQNKTAEVVPAGEMPRRLQFSADGKRGYVTNRASSSVAVLDTITDSVITTLQLDGQPEALALSGDGKRLYVTDYWAGTLTAISVASVVRDLDAA